MENLDIEKIIIENFYKMIKNANCPEEQIKEHINQINTRRTKYY